jgi:hypothetical protein
VWNIWSVKLDEKIINFIIDSIIVHDNSIDGCIKQIIALIDWSNVNINLIDTKNNRVNAFPLFLKIFWKWR